MRLLLLSSIDKLFEDEIKSVYRFLSVSLVYIVANSNDVDTVFILS